MKRTKKLNVRVYTECYYDSFLFVPEELSLEEAFEYAKNHLDCISCTEFIPLDEEELDPEDLTNSKHTYFS